MKFVMLPRQEGEEVAINAETIELLVPKDGRTVLHTTSGKAIGIELPFDEVIQRLTQQGWRK
jgi:uncharacterized protein YlzI (FlbEa/FlbD family)